MGSSYFIVCLAVLLTIISSGHSFFLYGKKTHNFDRSGPSNNNNPWQQYSTRAEAMWSQVPGPQQGQVPTYAFDASSGSVTVALPVAVPVQAAQMATAALTPPAHSPPPAATLHNVQLVPCLCPVAKDFDPLPPPPPTVSPSSPSFVIQNSSPP